MSTSTDTGPATPPAKTDPPPGTGSGGNDGDFGDDVDKWKSHSRKHETENGRLKAEVEKKNKELEDLRAKTMSEAEKAIAAARDEGKAEALKTVGGRLVDAELKAALVGKAVKPEALLGFDRSGFLTADGDVDAAAIKKWVDENTTSVEAKPDPPKNPRRPAAVAAPKDDDASTKQSASLLRQMRGTT